MTDEERKKLIDDIEEAIWNVDPSSFSYSDELSKMASAALAIAERRIREDCAEIARKAPAVICDNAIDYARGVKKIIAAILSSIPKEQN